LVAESSEMPDFVMEAIHAVVFPLLAHIQLSIREQAVRAISSYIARCNRQVGSVLVLVCFKITFVRRHVATS
jgi:hypothetical protein